MCYNYPRKNLHPPHNLGKTHAPEVGNKVSVAVTSRGGWLVGAKSFTGNPYDGHTLAAQLQQVNNLIGGKVSEA